MTVLKIDIWSDVVCPWCPIGHAGLQKALAELDGEVEAQIRWRPYQLSPDTPPEGRTQKESFEQRAGKTLAELAPIYSRVSEAGDAAGFAIPFQADGMAMIWNTFAAHKLLRWALDTAGPEAQARLSDALFRANFHDRRNISDDDVLAQIAGEAGLDADAAKAALGDLALDEAVANEIARGQQMGITSVPTFVVNGKYGLTGGQPPEVFVKALRQIAAETAA